MSSNGPNYWKEYEELRNSAKKYEKLTKIIWLLIYIEAIIFQIRYCKWILHMVSENGIPYIAEIVMLNIFFIGMIFAMSWARKEIIMSRFRESGKGYFPGEKSIIFDVMLLIFHSGAFFYYFPGIIPPGYGFF